MMYLYFYFIILYCMTGQKRLILLTEEKSDQTQLTKRNQKIHGYQIKPDLFLHKVASLKLWNSSLCIQELFPEFVFPEFLFPEFVFPRVCISRVCISGVPFPEFAFPEFAFPEFVFLEFVFSYMVMAPCGHLSNHVCI